MGPPTPTFPPSRDGGKQETESKEADEEGLRPGSCIVLTRVPTTTGPNPLLTESGVVKTSRTCKRSLSSSDPYGLRLTRFEDVKDLWEDETM